MYESPINIIRDIYSDLQIKFEDEVFKAVTKVGIDVNKEELIKALKYDRGQYEFGYNIGYKDGYNANKWISCKDELPKVMGRYLTCDHKGNMHVFSHNPNYPEVPFGVSEYDTHYYQPVAWQELPEAYKED